MLKIAAHILAGATMRQPPKHFGLADQVKAARLGAVQAISLPE